MASERIVSPGVFTREKDLSFLPQGIADIGAAIIGPTVKGPAFVPTQVTSFSEFENIFGGYDSSTYVPLTVAEYIKNAPTVTIVRIMGLGGYRHSTLHLVMDSEIAATLKPTNLTNSQDFNSGTTAIANATKAQFELTINNVVHTASLDPTSDAYITKVFGEEPKSRSSQAYVYANFRNFQKIFDEFS